MTSDAEQMAVIEDIREYAMNMRDRDGLPPAGSQEIRLHLHTDLDNPNAPRGARAASFWHGGTVYMLVARPTASEDETYLLHTPYLSLSGPGRVGDIVNGLTEMIERDQVARARNVAKQYDPQLLNPDVGSSFIQAADAAITRSQAITARLVEVHETMGLMVPRKLQAIAASNRIVLDGTSAQEPSLAPIT